MKPSCSRHCPKRQWNNGSVGRVASQSRSAREIRTTIVSENIHGLEGRDLMPQLGMTKHSTSTSTLAEHAESTHTSARSCNQVHRGRRHCHDEEQSFSHDRAGQGRASGGPQAGGKRYLQRTHSGCSLTSPRGHGPGNRVRKQTRLTWMTWISPGPCSLTIQQHR